MSIKTELDRIIDEVMLQSSLLDQALIALENKVAGGNDATVEDYTVDGTDELDQSGI